MIPERLNLMITTGEIPHSLMFTGKGAAEAASSFGKNVIAMSGEHHLKKLQSKNHPDFHELFPEGKTLMHPIKALKELSKEAFLAPLESKWKVFILYDAERMLPTSANALLKIFEEPPNHTLILLVTDHQEKILPTIRSRCQLVEFAASLAKAVEMLDLLSGQISREEFLEKSQEKISSDPAFVNSLFETVVLWFRDRQLLELGDTATRFLAFPDFKHVIKESALIPLERVEKAVQLAKTGFERSIRFNVCLESLFLSLFCDF